MIILVVNTGSSSLKYQLFDMDDHKVLAKGLCERIGEDGHMNYKTDAGTVFDKDIALPDHGVAMQLVIDALTDKEYGVISDMSEIGAVGHRIVQGGYLFDKSEIITDEVEKGIEELMRLYVVFHEEAKNDPSLEDEARAWFHKMELGDEARYGYKKLK